MLPTSFPPPPPRPPPRDSEAARFLVKFFRDNPDISGPELEEAYGFALGLSAKGIDGINPHGPVEITLPRLSPSFLFQDGSVLPLHLFAKDIVKISALAVDQQTSSRFFGLLQAGSRHIHRLLKQKWYIRLREKGNAPHLSPHFWHVLGIVTTILCSALSILLSAWLF